MANQRGMGKTDLPHFIHATTILYHFAPLSTTCMSIIVQKLGIGKDFLRFYSKSAREILEKKERADALNHHASATEDIFSG